MKHWTSILALALAILLPTRAVAQGDKEVRSAGEVPQGQIEPIARALQQGQSIDADWQALLESHADAMAEDDVVSLAIRVLEEAWAPAAAGLDRTAAEIEAAGACPEQASALAGQRRAIATTLAMDRPAADDLQGVSAAMAGLSESLAACQGEVAQRREKLAAAEREPKVVEADAVREPDSEEAPVRTTVADVDIQGQAADLSALQGVENQIQGQSQQFHALASAARAMHDIAMAAIQNMK